MDPNTPTINSSQPEQKSSKNTLLTLASILVLAGIIGFTLFLYIKNKTSKQSLSQITSTKSQDQKTITDKSIPKNYVPTTTEEKKMAANLKKYGVVCKRFTSIEEALKTPDIACILDLSGQKLSFLPSTIKNLSSLTELNLSNNNFTSFPPVLNNTPSLTLINLTNNKLTVTPDISKLTNLQSLILTGNPIKDKATITPAKASPSGTPPPSTSTVKIIY